MARHCVNKVELIGFVGKDPVVRYMPNGDAVVNFSLATTDYWTDRETKEKKERTEWHRCVAYGKFAEDIVGKLVKQGAYIRLEGKNRTRKWQKDNIDHYTTEVVFDDMILLDKAPADKPPVSTPPEDEDIPF